MILEELGLYDDVLDIGLDFNVGVGGRRLTGAQRQKLDLARALLKRADFFVLNRPLLALDTRLQDQILRNVLEEAKTRRPFAGHHVGSASPVDGKLVRSHHRVRF